MTDTATGPPAETSGPAGPSESAGRSESGEPSGAISRLAAIEGTCHATAARRAARFLSAAYDQALASSGLRIGQFSLLRAAAVHGPLPLAELARLLAMDRTTLAANLKPLARDGLLAVEPAERDRRVREVRATGAGVARLLRALPLWERAQDEFGRAYGADRASGLRAELAAVLDSGPRPW